jgi:ATP-binding cassette subfamily C protein LapB
MLAGRCIAPLAQATALATRYGATRTAWQTLDRLITAAEPPQPAAVRPGPLAGALMFDQVRFTYPGAERPAVDGLCFSIAPGERVAVVGRSGSGKSTLVRLALGLLPPESGAIRRDGHDLRALHPDDLSDHTGAALQDALLFSGSIAENLRLDRSQLSDSDLLAAARLAGADTFIGALPQGYGTRLADRGEGLSGGQRQSLALARALVGPGGAPPPLLLLDEPTSALDLTSEAALIERLVPALEGRTLLMVTHRPSALRLASRILLIEDGRIIADGPKVPMLQRLGLPQA